MTILIMGGRPGTGKSTIVKEFIRKFGEGKQDLKLAPLLNSVYLPTVDTYIFGKYEEGEKFPGTDRLSMSVQPRAVEWIKNNMEKNILIEGDRLFNSKFINSIQNMEVLIISSREEILKERYERRGSNQSEKFLKGRETKVNNILNAHPKAEVLQNNGEGDIEEIISLLERKYNIIQ